jgi:hypothetical protein
MNDENHKTSPLDKVGLESLDESLDKFRELMKRWNERLTFGSLKMDKRFEAGNLRILIPFREVHGFKRGIIVLEPVVPVESIAVAENVGTNCYQSPVLVDVVRFMKSPERIIPASVRLEFIDELHSSWFNESLYFSTSEGFITLERFANRERNLSQNCVACVGIGDQSKVVHHMVEGASEVLQNVPGNGKHIEVDDREFSEVRLALSKFRILLGDSNMSVGVPVSLRSRFEFSEVLFGPFDLYPDRDKSFFSAQRHDAP